MIRRFFAARAMKRAVARAKEYQARPFSQWDVQAQVLLDKRAAAAAQVWAAL